MARTPDRRPGEADEEGIILENRSPGDDPSQSGGIRYVNGSFKFRDVSGLFNPRFGQPGGENTEVQFNNSGVLSGSNTFTFDYNTATLRVTNLSGSLTRLANGTSYLVAGPNIQITTGSNGSVTITGTTSGASLVGGSDTQVQFNDGGSAFGGSPGLTYNKTTQALTGTYVVASTGFSGSLTRLTNGTSYLIAGSNVTIVTGSSGGVTISAPNLAPSTSAFVTIGNDSSLSAERSLAAGIGLSLTDGGANSNVTLAINDSVVATVSGTTFTGVTRHSAGLSGSLTQLTNGTSYLIAGANIGITTGSSGAVTISNTAPTFYQWNELSPSPRLNTTASVSIAGGLGSSYAAESVGTDVYFFVSGTIDGPVEKKSVFGGDILVSGSVFVTTASNYSTSSGMLIAGSTRTTATSVARAISISAGNGVSGITGGAVSISAGTGAGAGSNGGALTLSAGSGLAGASAGGALTVSAGNSTGATAAGALSLSAGSASSTTAGASGGSISLFAGDIGSGGSGTAGSVELRTGAGATAAASTAGRITLTAQPASRGKIVLRQSVTTVTPGTDAFVFVTGTPGGSDKSVFGGDVAISGSLFMLGSSTIVGAPEIGNNQLSLISSGNVLVQLDTNNNGAGHVFDIQDYRGISQFKVNENGNADLSGSLYVTGSAFLTGSLFARSGSFSGDVFITGTLYGGSPLKIGDPVGIGTRDPGPNWLAVVGSSAFSGSVEPGSNNTSDLGSATKRWRTVFATNISGSLTGSNVTAGQVVVAGTGGVLSGSNLLWWDNANSRVGVGTSSFIGFNSTIEVSGNISVQQRTDNGTQRIQFLTDSGGATNPTAFFESKRITSYGSELRLRIDRAAGGGGNQNAWKTRIFDDPTSYPQQNTHTTFNVDNSGGTSSTGVFSTAVVYIGSGSGTNNTRASLYTENDAWLAVSRGAVGIGTSNTNGNKVAISGGNLSVSGSIFPFPDNGVDLGSSVYRWRNIYATSISGSLTGSNVSAGQVVVAGTGGVLSGSNNFWWDNTNRRIGIGISSGLGAKIQVSGTGSDVANIGGFTAGDAYVYAGNLSTYGILGAYRGDRGASLPLVLQSAGGNVGIGAVPAAYKLEVNGAAIISGSQGLVITTAEDPSTYATNNGGQTMFSMRTVTNAASYLAGQSFGSIFGYTRSSNSYKYSYQIAVDVNGVLRYRSALDASNWNPWALTVDGGTGNVGIGTTSFTGRLYVSGSSTASTPTAVVREGVVSPTGGVGVFDVQNSAGTSLLFVSGSGNVGIGTSTPTAKLHVVQGSSPNFANLLVGSGGTSTNFYDANEHYFRNGSLTTNLYMTVGGNVGIGTTLLDSKFVVNGNSVLSGTLNPDTDNARDLGSSTKRWRTLFAANISGSLTGSGLAVGSVVFAGTGGLLTGSNSQFFWNTSSNRLGIGTSSPTFKLEVSGSDINVNGTRFGRGNNNIAGNVAVGNSALSSVLDGIDLTGVGDSALSSNTTGDDNTGIGYGTLFVNSTGINNTAVGSFSLFSVTVNSDNTAVGSLALGSAEGARNTAIGSSAGGGVTVGQYNTMLGYNAGGNITGSHNTVIGGAVGESGTTGSIILSAGPTERIRVNSLGNVGIGTTNPTARLFVTGSGTSSTPTAVFRTGLPTPTGAVLDVQSNTGGTLLHVSGSGDVGVNVFTVVRTATLVTTDASPHDVMTISSTEFRSAEFMIQGSDPSKPAYKYTRIHAVHDGSTSYHTEYGSVTSGFPVGTFDVTDPSGGNFTLQVTSDSGNTTTWKVTAILTRA